MNAAAGNSLKIASYETVSIIHPILTADRLANHSPRKLKVRYGDRETAVEALRREAKFQAIGACCRLASSGLLIPSPR